MGERLQKYLARAGVGSRRKAEELITSGRVTIDGRVARLGDRVPEGAEVRVDGRPVAPPGPPVVIALHKPRGYTTTKSDPHAERTVYELLPEIPGLVPVGRLDRDSEGLLLFTTWGELAHRLAHPRFQVPKVYRAYSRRGTPPPRLLKRLERGIVEGGERLFAKKARPAPVGALLTLTEGKKREVRRMMRAIGYPVERLVRVKFGPVRLAGLAPGRWKKLSEEELAELARAVRLSPKEETWPRS